MRQKSEHPESSSERLVQNIRRAIRKRHSSEEKIRIVLDGLRGEGNDLKAEYFRAKGIDVLVRSDEFRGLRFSAHTDIGY